MRERYDEDFEFLIDRAVEGRMDESAILHHYFLVHYPYYQGSGEQEAEGALARYKLDRRFRSSDGDGSASASVMEA